MHDRRQNPPEGDVEVVRLSIEYFNTDVLSAGRRSFPRGVIQINS